jgi:LysR family transcriptional regulator, cys regulon transcriptional activator
MNLQQLRYVAEVVRCGLSVSEAASQLDTSQPGISKQITCFEEELGLEVFIRRGKRIAGLTPPGERILPIINIILQQITNLARVSDEFRHEREGALTIATTHTQARYILPPVIEKFREAYPLVRVCLKQGNPIQVGRWVISGEADVGIATDAIGQMEGMITLPGYSWNHFLIAPHGHPVLNYTMPTLQELSGYPLITYDDTITGGATIHQMFVRQGVIPNVALSALDADVIKTYVEMGMGIGIVAEMAYSATRDKALGAVSLQHLFPASTTKIGVALGTFLRKYVLDFLKLFSPGMDVLALQAAVSGKAPEEHLELA